MAAATRAIGRDSVLVRMNECAPADVLVREAAAVPMAGSGDDVTGSAIRGTAAVSRGGALRWALSMMRYGRRFQTWQVQLVLPYCCASAPGAVEPLPISSRLPETRLAKTYPPPGYGDMIHS